MRHWVVISLLVSLSAFAPAGEDLSREAAAAALRKAAEFFRTQVATEGGYLWRYSDDLSKRQGEGTATATMIWVQPPGTPAVGMAFLAAHEATGDAYYLDAARQAACALVRGQLRSGGWDYSIDFNPKNRKKFAYRADEGSAGKNVTTLDDDTTQAALRLLMRVDKALEFKDAQIHEAAEFALNSLLKAQYPNGAWPQRYDQFPEPEKFPVKAASFPESWEREYKKQDYRGHCTLNDNTLADMISTMLEAARIYNEPTYRAAAEKGGGFILLAQLPEPQPAWAQQYDAEMRPAWARKFEPPAVTGGESQGAMRTLLMLYRETGDKKYLEPLPRAIAYLRKSRLPEGRLARFYEMGTNKPLYFTRDYKLTYDDADMPTHYSFKVSDGVDRIAADYERLKALDPAELQKPEKNAPPKLIPALAARAQSVAAALDDKGRWLDKKNKDRVIECRTFIHNVGTLSEYLAATREAK